MVVPGLSLRAAALVLVTAFGGVAWADSDPPCNLFPGDGTDSASIPSAREELPDERPRLAFPGTKPDARENPPPEKRFWTASAELAGLEVLPWAFNRYVKHRDFAHISIDTIKKNFETGFTYDHDHFKTNQSTHPYHGSLYYNAARSNGFSFWESAPFALIGSFLWECCMESEPPAINDLVNTTMGGITRGEVFHRLSILLLDRTQSGFGRLWREAGAFALDPVAGVNRLLRGELLKEMPNPDDRLPSGFAAWGEAFYRHRGGSGPGGVDTNQAGVSLSVRYGDPFDGEHRKPFEFFEFSTDFAHPAAVLITRTQERGLLTDWTLSDNPAIQHRLAIFMRLDYFNDAPVVYGAQSFSIDHLFRVPISRGVELRAEAGVSGMPMGAIQVDYESVGTQVAGRSYDYGPGGGVHGSAKMRRREVDLATFAWSVVWQHESDGISRNSRFQTILAAGRAPLSDHVALGVEWSWANRLTTYETLPTVHRSGTSWRFFGAWSPTLRP